MNTNAESIRVVIISNQLIIREGLRGLLSSYGTIVITGEFNSIDEAVLNFHPLQADIAIATLASRNFSHAVFKWSLIPIPTLVLLPDASRLEVLTIQSAGVKGLLPQGSPAQNYVDAIEVVSKGSSYFSLQIRPFLEHSTLPTQWFLLTNRERLIFCLMTSGLSSTEIAASMNVSTVAIRSYRRKLYKKMETSDTSGLARIATKYGFVP